MILTMLVCLSVCLLYSTLFYSNLLYSTHLCCNIQLSNVGILGLLTLTGKYVQVYLSSKKGYLILKSNQNYYHKGLIIRVIIITQTLLRILSHRPYQCFYHIGLIRFILTQVLIGLLSPRPYQGYSHPCRIRFILTQALLGLLGLLGL